MSHQGNDTIIDMIRDDLELKEAVIAERIENGQCIACGSALESEDNLLYDLGDPGDPEDGGGRIPSHKLHANCDYQEIDY